MYLGIRQERERHKWTLENVAKMVELSKPAIHDIETGRRKPSFDVLVKLLDLFGKKEAVKQIRQLFAVIDESSNL